MTTPAPSRLGVPIAVEVMDFSAYLDNDSPCGINGEGHLSDSPCVAASQVWRLTPDHTPGCGCDGTGPYVGCGYTYYVCVAHIADAVRALHDRRTQ